MDRHWRSIDVSAVSYCSGQALFVVPRCAGVLHRRKKDPRSELVNSCCIHRAISLIGDSAGHRPQVPPSPPHHKSAHRDMLVARARRGGAVCVSASQLFLILHLRARGWVAEEPDSRLLSGGQHRDSGNTAVLVRLGYQACRQRVARRGTPPYACQQCSAFYDGVSERL